MDKPKTKLRTVPVQCTVCKRFVGKDGCIEWMPTEYGPELITALYNHHLRTREGKPYYGQAQR